MGAGRVCPSWAGVVDMGVGGTLHLSLGPCSPCTSQALGQEAWLPQAHAGMPLGSLGPACGLLHQAPWTSWA